jgi:hypothetical protein
MTRSDDAALIATLNDLLQLEHDALPAYGLAIAGLRTGRYRDALSSFRDDHRRHVLELTRLIRQRGGVPIGVPHVPTGILKLMVQMAGLPGGERAVLLAFRANEWQSQMKYGRKAALETPPEVGEVLRRAAADEARHYIWAVDTLEELGLGSGTMVGMANGAFARFHGLMAEGIEAGERLGLEALARLSRPPAG